MADNKKYLDEQYRLAMLDYRTAHTEQEQWDARMRMAQVERTASELYGFDFADQLHYKHINNLKKM